MDNSLDTPDTGIDPTVQLLKARLAQRARISPLQSGIAHGLNIAFGGNSPNPQEQNLKESVLLNQLQTGSPEFELKKAQVLANMWVMKDLQTKQLEADQVKAAADKAGATDNGPSMPPLSSNSGPNLPSGPIYPGNGTPALVSGIGALQPPQTPANTDNFDPTKPKFIQEPPTSEFDPRAMANIKKPGKQIIDPQWQSKLDVQKALQQDKAIKASELNATADSASNVLNMAVSKFKDLQASGSGGGRIAGAFGAMKQPFGGNAQGTTWDSFTNSAAAILAAAASPRTPTLLVQYYKNALGPQNQTAQEFAGRISNLQGEMQARKSGYSGEFDQNKMDEDLKQILSTPASKALSIGKNTIGNKPSYKIGDKKVFADGVTRTRQADGTWQ